MKVEFSNDLDVARKARLLPTDIDVKGNILGLS